MGLTRRSISGTNVTQSTPFTYIRQNVCHRRFGPKVFRFSMAVLTLLATSPHACAGSVVGGALRLGIQLPRLGSSTLQTPPSLPCAPAPQPPPSLLLSRRGGGGKKEGLTSIIFSGLGGFLKRVVSTLLAPLAGSSPPSFTSTFEKEFGTAHVPFLEAPSLPLALAQARASCRFLIVYLPSSSPRDEKRHKAFCRTLTAPSLHRFAAAAFVLWAPPPASAPYRTAGKELKARYFPYLAVVHGGKKGGREGGRAVSVKSLHHFRPPPTPEQAIMWLNRTMEIHGHVLDADKTERDFVLRERKLQLEQKQEYSKALQSDRKREAKERAEVAAAAAVAAAAQRKKEKDEARRARKKAALGAEPKEEAGKSVCRIAVRMPGLNGQKKLHRAFRSDESLEQVFDWMDVEGLEQLEGAKMVLAGRRGKGGKGLAFTYPQDCKMSLADAGIGGQVLLLVESGPTREGGTGKK